MVVMVICVVVCCCYLEVKLVFLGFVYFGEGYLKNVYDWLEKNSGLKDNLMFIGLELLGLRGEV